MPKKETKSDLLSKYGAVFHSGLTLRNYQPSILPISPAIDFALGGGIPEGSLVSFAGPPGCGKTSTVLQFIANAQQKEYNVNGNTRKIFYADVEHRIKKLNLSGIHDLDVDNIQFIRSTKGNILSAQDFLDIIENIIKDEENEGCIVVVDSASALCPSDELETGTSGTIRTTQPKIMSHWCKKIASPIKVMNATVILIQHLITNTSGYGQMFLVDGGEKLKYQLDVKLITKGQPEKWINDDIQIGQVVKWDVIKSALSSPTRSAKSCLKYGYGLDSMKELSILGIELGIIQKGGAWFSFTIGDKTAKFQGEEKLCQGLYDNPEYAAFVRDSIKSLA